MKASAIRKMGLAISAGLLMTLSIVAAAWACTQSAYLEAANPQKALVGAETTVSGGSFNPGPVQIRWNSANGPIVATVNGPSFSAKVVAPTGTAPGIYYIVAVQKDSKGTILGKGATAFEVATASPVTTGPSSPFGTGGFSAPATEVDSQGKAPAKRQITTIDSGAQGAAAVRDDLWSGFARQRGAIGQVSTPSGETGARAGAGMAAGITLMAAGTLAAGALGALAIRSRRTETARR